VKFLGIAFAVVALVGLVLVGLSLAPPNKEIPPELLGVWATEAESHADRVFTITDSTLIFQTGETDSVIYTVVEVIHNDTDSGAEYVIRHDVDGSVAEFAFYYMAMPEPLIQFKNQRNMDWRRAGS
jgi:hypothetical protein